MVTLIHNNEKLYNFIFLLLWRKGTEIMCAVHPKGPFIYLLHRTKTINIDMEWWYSLKKYITRIGIKLIKFQVLLLWQLILIN